MSRDGGLAWDLVAAGDSDLYAVQVASDGALIIAVGEVGQVVRIDGDEVSAGVVVEGDLRALHIDATGHGAVVGRGGAFLLIDDAGRSLSTIEVGSSADLLGVDALGHVHLGSSRASGVGDLNVWGKANPRTVCIAARRM